MKRLLDLIHTGVRLGGVDSSSPAPASSISAILRHPPLGVSFSPAAARLGRRRSGRRGVRTPADGAPIATTRSSQSPTSGNATECKSDAFEHSTIVDFEGLAPTCEGREHCKRPIVKKLKSLFGGRIQSLDDVVFFETSRYLSREMAARINFTDEIRD